MPSKKRRRPYRRKSGANYKILAGITDDGSEYPPEAVEFLKAVDRLKRLLGRQPSDCEVLRLLKSLGWRK